MGTYDTFKSLVGIDVGDLSMDTEIAEVFEQAGRKIIERRFPFAQASVTSVPSEYLSLQNEIAVFLWGKRGAEGETTHSENGVSRTYASADVPWAMLSGVVPKVDVL